MAAVKTKADLEHEKLLAEIAKLKSEKAYIDIQRRSFQNDLDDDDVEPLQRRILPFLHPVNDRSVTGAMYHLHKMAAKSSDPITIWLNSPGGYVVDGLALFDYIISLRETGIEINTVVLGEAASMGGILLQAGTKRYVGASAHILIHEVSAGAIGKASEIEDELAYIERLQKRLVSILAERSTLSPVQIKRKWKRTDWWLDADEAIDLGFADGVYHP